jgi:hypothetical protein
VSLRSVSGERSARCSSLASWFFAAVEGAQDFLSWRLIDKRRTARLFLEYLRSKNFPQRRVRDDGPFSFMAYLLWVEECTGDYSKELRLAAHDLFKQIEFLEAQGTLHSRRIRAAWDAALEAHSPNSSVPESWPS